MEKTVPFRMYLPKIRVSRSTQLTIISFLFIGLYIYTGSNKLLDIHSFQGAMRKSAPIANYSKILSYVIPNIEMIIAILLFYPMLTNKTDKVTLGTKIGLLGSLLMMVGFTGYVGYILFYYPHQLPCTCGGLFRYLTWEQHLIINILLLALALWGVWLVNKGQIKIFFAKIGKMLAPVKM